MKDCIHATLIPALPELVHMCDYAMSRQVSTYLVSCQVVQRIILLWIQQLE